MTVRPATVDDAEAIARVHAASWQVAYRGIVADDFLDGLTPDGWVDRWRGNLADTSRDVTTLVSMDSHDGDDRPRVTGFATTGPVRDPDPPGPGWHELWGIYLDPAVWGQGLGSRLLTAALATAPDDVPGVSLWVFRDNRRARSFYERHGFRADGLEQGITVGEQELPEVRYRRVSAAGTTMGW